MVVTVTTPGVVSRVVSSGLVKASKTRPFFVVLRIKRVPSTLYGCADLEDVPIRESPFDFAELDESAETGQWLFY